MKYFAASQSLCRGLVEVGVGEQPQTRRCRWESHNSEPTGTVAAARAELDPGIFRLVGERIGRTIGRRASSIRPKRFGIGLGRRVEARLVDQAEIAPAAGRGRSAWSGHRQRS